ncbi:hypothetical protein MJO29_014024 [Puccinia striiformis f. sp. tritici]|nr:hypothetical protein MJO29_014024 [Puccinia striiformis f. sp. tritici]
MTYDNKEEEEGKAKEEGTSWMKVTTTAGNVFYTTVETKIRVAEIEQAQLKAEETQRIHKAEQRRMIKLEVQKGRGSTQT